jgi:hypothetical protein
VDISVFKQKIAEYEIDIRKLLKLRLKVKSSSEKAEILKEIVQLHQKCQKKEAEIIAEQRKVLYVDHPASFYVVYKDENIRSQKKRLLAWKKSVSEFKKLVDASLIQDAVTIKPTLRKRSFFREGDANLNRFNGVASGIHELGHYLENSNPYVHDRALAFLERRTRGNKLESLRELTGDKNYEAGEMARQGNFILPYMGKIYRDVYGNITGTEIISAGMENMWKNPVSFAKKDPDYFDFLIDVLRGQA